MANLNLTNMGSLSENGTFVSSVVFGDDGAVYLAGCTNSGPGVWGDANLNPTVWCYRDGALVWKRVFEGAYKWEMFNDLNVVGGYVYASGGIGHGFDPALLPGAQWPDGKPTDQTNMGAVVGKEEVAGFYVKFDAQTGNTVFAKIADVNASGSMMPTTNVVDSDGNVYLTIPGGHITPWSDGGLYKYGPNGEFLWHSSVNLGNCKIINGKLWSIGGDYIRQIDMDTGEQIAMLSQEVDFEWFKGGDASTRDFIIDENGDFIVVLTGCYPDRNLRPTGLDGLNLGDKPTLEQISAYAPMTNILIRKISGNFSGNEKDVNGGSIGTVVWEKTLDLEGWATTGFKGSVLFTPAKNIMVAGTTIGKVNGATAFGTYDAFYTEISNVDTDVINPGEILGTRIIGSRLKAESASTAVYDSSGNLYMAGEFNSKYFSLKDSGFQNIYLISDAGFTLMGDELDNVIQGGDGVDTVFGGGGNDLLNGGLGNDSLDGGDGWDVANYESCEENVVVNLQTGLASGLDVGRDALKKIEEARGGVGADILTAKDRSKTDPSGSKLVGGDGSDKLNGGTGNDILYGGDGNDSVNAGDGNDEIVGGDGAGDDSYVGGGGVDTIKYSSALAGITVNLSATKDHAKSTNAASNDAGIGTDQLSQIENVIGGDFSDIITGSSVANRLDGGEGADTLSGAEGNDSLSGQGGDDTLNGGAGVDTFSVTAGTDAISDLGAGGADILVVSNGATANASVATSGWTATAATVNRGVATISTNGYAVSLAAINSTSTNGFRVTNTSTSGTSLIGSFLNDTLSGGAGNDMLQGGLEVDSLNGGEGSDIYLLTSVADYANGEVIADAGTLGTDEIRFAATAAGTLTLASSISGIERIVIGTGSGAAAITTATTALNINASALTDAANLTGNAGANSLIGGNGNDSIIGNAGNDMLSGGQGSDSLDGGVGNDVLDGGAGDDALTGGAGNDTFRITGGTDAVLDLGNGGADVLNVAAGATANATVTAAWTATAATVNRGAASISTNGFAVNLSAVTTTGTNGFTVTNTTTTTGARVTLTGSGLNDALIGGSSNDTLVGNAGNDTLSGGIGLDALNGGVGADALDGGAGNDILVGGDGADTLAGGDGADSLTGGSGADVFVLQGNDTVADYDGAQGDTLNLTALANGNIVTFTTVRGQLDLSSSSSTAAFIATANALGSTITGGAGADTLNGGNGVDVLTGGGGADRLNGGGGNDALRGGIGADTLTGGAGRDTFLFSEGDSGQGTGFDLVMDFAKGKVGTGDLIDYAVDLTRGGNANAATDTQASIHQTTGIATFANGSGTTLTDALGDIAARFTAGAGEFALFRVNNTGAFHLFISDGTAGVTANDVVVQLVGVTSVASIDLTGGNLTILT